MLRAAGKKCLAAPGRDSNAGWHPGPGGTPGDHACQTAARAGRRLLSLPCAGTHHAVRAIPTAADARRGPVPAQTGAADQPRNNTRSDRRTTKPKPIRNPQRTSDSRISADTVNMSSTSNASAQRDGACGADSLGWDASPFSFASLETELATGSKVHAQPLTSTVVPRRSLESV